MQGEGAEVQESGRGGRMEETGCKRQADGGRVRKNMVLSKGARDMVKEDGQNSKRQKKGGSEKRTQ